MASSTSSLPDARHMIAFGRSLGLADGAIRKAFTETTGAHRTEGWTPTREACHAWASAMEAQAKRLGLMPEGWRYTV